MSENNSVPATPESVEHYIREGILFEPVLPQIGDWPITQLTRNRKQHIQDVTDMTIARLLALYPDTESFQNLIARTMYLEQNRIKEEPWKVDPPDDKSFWSRIKKGLIRNEKLPEAEEFEKDRAMIEQIVSRYSHEISGTFRPGTYHFAKRVIPFLFATLLNAASGYNLKAIFNHKLHIQDKVELRGEIDAIRNLASKGTILLVPTHFSNLDSILIGWGIHALGLPAFLYGAGWNLFNTSFFAYFMSKLGAYKVDRRKKNPIYLETLKTYSTTALQRGCHSLFFPGGTRSRSGALESRLKLGLLGTAIEAQRLNLVHTGESPADKIFVIPLTIGYHFVLEAPSLIHQHLKRTGEEQYFKNDESRSIIKMLQFSWKSLSRGSEFSLNFGKPMDVFGNFVDEEGNSFDQNNRPIDIRKYFITRGEMHEDAQRDAEYTRMLGNKIMERYRIENVVFSSHLVAFVAFRLFQRRFPNYSLYELLRFSDEDRHLPLDMYMEALGKALTRLHEMESQGLVHLAGHLINDARRILEHGLSNLGLYHDQRPLMFRDEATLKSQNMNLLYFYHNRLDGYELEQYF